MRVAAAVVLVAALAVPAAQRNSGFFPVAVGYPLSPGASVASIVGDLQVIRTAGFNTIKLTWPWRIGEPVRGKYEVETIDRTLAQAGRLGLRVILALDSAAPAWILERYADAERQTSAGRAREACFDHPGVHADAIAFVNTMSATAARHNAVLAIDVGSHRPAGLCLCPHTTRRLQSLAAAQTLDDAARARNMHRYDLQELVAAVAASSRLTTASRTSSPSLLSEPAAYAPDDWAMAGVVDRYGQTVHARTSMRAAADNLASATRATGWWADVDATVPEEDRRLAAWTAISRGAQALSFDDPPNDLGFIRSIVRNPALFTELRPRRAQVALLFDPSSPAGRADLLAAHHELYRRQITTDIHNVEQLGGSELQGYRAIVAASSREWPKRAREAIASARAAGAAYVDAARPADAVEAVVRAGLVPEVRIDGGSEVEVRFLESATVQMMVGLNHASQSQRVTMVFSPDTQEAIWLNMETGSGVNFVAGPTGPIYQYWFRPKDVLVLMIRKDIR